MKQYGEGNSKFQITNKHQVPNPKRYLLQNEFELLKIGIYLRFGAGNLGFLIIKK